MKRSGQRGHRTDDDGSPSAVQLTLLNGFALDSSGRFFAIGAVEQRVLALLALRDQPVYRPQLAGTLWLDATDARAMANLRGALWRLRQAGLDELVENVGDSLRLSPAVVVDMREVAAAAERLLDGRESVDPGALARLRTAGELLPDWSEDWVEVERVRFRQFRLHALERACEQYESLGDYGRAIDTGLAAVASDPLRESAHRAVIRVHLAEGNLAEAVRQYHVYERLMRDELGLPPSGRMQELVRSFVG